MTPIISGTVAGQTTSGSSIEPFATANTSDGNPGPSYVTDTLTISLLGSDGTPTDANGALASGPETGNTTFDEISSGVYQLSVADPNVDTVTNSNILNAQLHNLTFTPSGSGTTTFSVLVTDIYPDHQSTDATTSVIASGGGTPPTTTATTSDTVSPTPAMVSPSTSTSPSFITSTSNGNTVLDASGGTNFRVGLASDGSLVVDERSSSSDSWSAVTTIGAGDTVTIDGVTADDFALGRTHRGQGSVGLSGPTLDVSASSLHAHGGRSVAALASGKTVDLFGGEVSASFSGGTLTLTAH
jgi:hypothetical protein